MQSEYRLIDRDGDGVMEFAASLLSSDNASGLYTGAANSPLGLRIAQASLNGYNDGSDDREAEPYGGYYYRILKGQTAAAPGGAMDYTVNGNMVAGHALLAVPANYGDTGVHSFMVSENGVVLQADLGEESLERAIGMYMFDPGDGWTRADE